MISRGKERCTTGTKKSLAKCWFIWVCILHNKCEASKDLGNDKFRMLRKPHYICDVIINTLKWQASNVSIISQNCYSKHNLTRLRGFKLKFSLTQYELRLVASDNLNENYTTVVIHVNDVNDNPPVFDRPTYETQITEEDDRNLPKRVLKVQNVIIVWFSLFGALKFCFVDF